MLTATDNKGFSMTFENGNTVSVQWGPGNYCEPDHEEGRNAPYDAPRNTRTWKARNAEVAAWNKDGAWHQFEHDSVDGWLSPDEVSAFIHFVATSELKTKREPCGDEDE